MAISGQSNIKIGNINSPQDSDTLYNAFHTIQNNFTTVFTTGSNAGNIYGANGVTVTQIPSGDSTDYKIENSGVTQLVAGDNITIANISGGSANTGVLVISATGGNGGGGVTSVGLQSGSSNRLVVTNSPIVSSGNIGIDLATISGVTGNYTNPNLTIDGYGRVTAVSNGVVNGVTSVAIAGGDGISVAGGPITSNGTITVTNTGVTGLVAGTGIDVSSSNGVVTITNTGGGGGGGGGTVTRVGVVPGSNNITVSGSPVVSSGNITVGLASNIVINSVATRSDNNTTPQISALLVSNNHVYDNWFSGARARGTLSALSNVIVGDTITRFQGYAYTQYNTYQRAAAMHMEVSELPSSSDSSVPSSITIESVGTSNLVYPMTVGDSGNVRLPGTIYNTVYSNVAITNTNFTTRARGNISNPQPVQLGDSLYRMQFFGYTGNGATSVWGVNNYSYGGGIDSVVAELPSSSGEWISSNIDIKTVSTSNTVLTSTFTNTGNLVIVNSFIGNGFSGNGSGLSSITGANVSGQVSNALISGTVYTNAQPNITSVGTLTSLGVSGTITAANITANTGVFTGNGSGISNLAGGNITGQVANALVAGTVYTAAQPNITSVGTLTSLSVTNSVNAGGNITANNVTTTNNVRAVNLIASSYVSGKLVTTTSAPTTSSSTGYAGQIAYDSTYVYICIAANTWKRAALTTW